MPAILQFEFMIRALIGGAIAKIPKPLGPVLGMFLVLRRFSPISNRLLREHR